MYIDFILFVGLMTVIAASITVIIIAVYLKKGKLKKAKDAYFNSLEKLKTDPKNTDLRLLTEHLGTEYSKISKGFPKQDVYEEETLRNAIVGAYLGINNFWNSDLTGTIEERLAKLAKLKEINSIKPKCEWGKDCSKISVEMMSRQNLQKGMQRIYFKDNEGQLKHMEVPFIENINVCEDHRNLALNWVFGGDMPD